MTLAAAALALFLGAALQSATGFGFALVSAPILFALLGPQEAVTAGILVALVLNGLTLLAGRRAFGWLRGARHETAVYVVLVATALVALATSLV